MILHRFHDPEMRRWAKLAAEVDAQMAYSPTVQASGLTPQYTSEQQDSVAGGEPSATGSVLTGQHFGMVNSLGASTTVGALTTIGVTALAPNIAKVAVGTGGFGTGTVYVQAFNGAAAVVATYTYTSITTGGSPSFNGLTLVSGTGSWSITAGSRVWTAPAFIPDAVAGASVLRGNAGDLGATDFMTVLNNRENIQAGLPPNPPGWVYPFTTEVAGLEGSLQWSNVSGGTASTLGAPGASQGGLGTPYASGIVFTSGAVGDAGRPFRRILVVGLSQTNGDGVKFATTGTVVTGATLDTNSSGLFCWDSGDLGSVTGTGFTATWETHVSGSGGAGVVLLGVIYLQSNGQNGTAMLNLSHGGTSVEDWQGTALTNLENFLSFMAGIGIPARRVILGDSVGDSMLNGTAVATVQTDLATFISGVQTATPLSNVVVFGVYNVGTSGTPGVGNAAWGSQWIPGTRQTAINAGALFVDAWARFGDVSFGHDPYGLTPDNEHLGAPATFNSPGNGWTQSASGRNAQQEMADFLWEKLGYPKVAGVQKGTLLAQVDVTSTQTYTVASTTPAAVDSTNLSVTFVVPPSQQVMVELSADYVFTTAASGNQVWLLFSGQTGTTQIGYHAFAHSGSTTAIEAIPAPKVVRILVSTGLGTPGALQTLRWAWGATVGTATIQTGGGTSGVVSTSDFGSAHMRVLAA